MDLALVVALGVTATLLAVACVLLAVVLVRGRDTRRALAASRAEVAALADRMEQLERARRAAPAIAETGFLITDVGRDNGSAEPVGDTVRTRVVMSAALAEPLVKAMAFGYGVRRALTPENRNRLRFEVRREVRRARKRRRRNARRPSRREATI